MFPEGCLDFCMQNRMAGCAFCISQAMMACLQSTEAATEPTPAISISPSWQPPPGLVLPSACLFAVAESQHRAVITPTQNW
jgi:hypothetical protein